MTSISFSRLGTSILFFFSVGCTTQTLYTGRIDTVPSKLSADRTVAGPVYFLPRVLTSITIERKVGSNGEVTDSFSTGDPIIVPDVSQAYRLYYGRSWFASDTISTTTNEKNLLTAINSTGEDQTGALVAKLTELAGQVAKLALLSERPQEAPRAFKISALVDLSIESDLDRVRALLKPFDSELELELSRPGWDNGLGAIGATPDKSSCEDKYSVCFRPVLPYRLSLSRPDGSLVGEAYALAPNEAPILGLNLLRFPFVRTEMKVEFAQGILTKFEVAKPSEALGLIQIPIDMAKALVAIPGELFDIELKSVQNEASILNAQAALITAQKALEEAKKPPKSNSAP